MAASILATKLYIPPPRLKVVSRPHLIERMNEGMHKKLTLISAPAGFGKTTLVSEWVTRCGRPASWLSLDEGDNDPRRFLAYLISAIRTAAKNIGEGIFGLLDSPKPLAIESVLTSLLNEIAAVPDEFILVLDDYHLIESDQVDHSIAFLIEHLPPQMHLILATREDPSLPLARLRARDQLTELRAVDLRFTPSEAAEFLNQVMGLDLSAENITALETRTEGWIAGLQLAAISMQGHKDATGFIQSFTGSHRFVMDYLVEEVLRQQTESVQTFLLRTSILDRLCGPLCESILLDPSVSGQATLEFLEHANLFIVPLDNERRWYRYHHLFAELLRQRLQQTDHVDELHRRASQWYESNHLMIDAFRHAVDANDIERAVRLMESKKMPLQLPGVAPTILNWLESLPATVLNAQPALWWKQASLLLSMGQTLGVEAKLQSTEAALSAATLPDTGPDETTRNLIGKIAVARALLAQTEYQVETSLSQSRRALDYLHPNNLTYRSTATQVMGFAYYLQGDWAEASQAYAESLSIAQTAGDVPNTIMAITRLGQIQEFGNQLYQAVDTYKQALQLIGEYPPPHAAVVYLGMGRIYYEWNDLDVAEQYGELGRRLAMQYDQIVDRLIVSESLLARLKLARGDAAGAARILAQTEQIIRQKNFTIRLPDIAADQVLVLLYQGNVTAAAQLAQQYNLPLSRARVFIAQNDPTAALTVLEMFSQQPELERWTNERIIVMVLQAIAYRMHGDVDQAMKALSDALVLAEPSGVIRTLVDEGPQVAKLLSEALSLGIMPDYVSRLLAAFATEQKPSTVDLQILPEASMNKSDLVIDQTLIDPLSQRELEVLRLIAQGLSNHEICRCLFLALDTVKGHNRKIFNKLQVQRRTEAIARARELGLL